jgi:hypothetical protein
MDSKKFVEEFSQAMLHVGEPIILVAEYVEDPNINTLENASMKVKIQKEDDNIVLDGETCSVGDNTSLVGPIRAESTKKIQCTDATTFVKEFDSFIDDLLSKDAQVRPQRPNDKPVDKKLWQSRINKGRDFGQTLFKSSL